MYVGTFLVRCICGGSWEGGTLCVSFRLSVDSEIFAIARGDVFRSMLNPTVLSPHHTHDVHTNIVSDDASSRERNRSPENRLLESLAPPCSLSRIYFEPQRRRRRDPRSKDSDKYDAIDATPPTICIQVGQVKGHAVRSGHETKAAMASKAGQYWLMRR